MAISHLRLVAISDFYNNTMLVPNYNYRMFVYVLFAEEDGSMTVTWVTLNSTRDTIVEYGVGGLTKSESGTQEVFEDGGPKKRVLYIHRVVLKDLKALQVYSEYIVLIFIPS